jgi:hypothetical protein
MSRSHFRTSSNNARVTATLKENGEAVLIRVAQGFGGAVLIGGLMAGSSAATLAVGAKVLSHAGYTGYHVGQAAAAGAVGSMALGGGAGMVGGLLLPRVDFTSARRMHVNASMGPGSIGVTILIAAAGAALGGAFLASQGYNQLPADRLLAAAMCGGLVLTAAHAINFTRVVLCELGVAIRDGRGL